MVSIYPHWRGSGWYFPQLVVRGENLLAANNVVENVLECTRMYENVWECRRMYAEKSWRVIMSPNDRVSTTWWRQTRPGTHQLLPEQKSWKICHQKKNQSLCPKKGIKIQVLTNISHKKQYECVAKRLNVPGQFYIFSACSTFTHWGTWQVKH